MIKFVNITEEEFLRSKLLFKHMPLENALRTLKDKTIWFANPTTWKDPFEKRFLEAKYTRDGKEVPFLWKGRVFCSCLTQTISSEAFWHAYSRDGIGVEFRIYREQLLNELSHYADDYKIFIGKAEYLKTDDIRRGLRDIPFNPALSPDAKLNSEEFASRLFLLKRISFAYEDEIRIIIVKKYPTKEDGIGLSYHCNNTDLIQRIVLDPSLHDYTSQMLKKVFINEFGFSSTKHGDKIFNRVLLSQLYADQRQAELKLD